jgi:hypothetical protein
LLQVQNNQTILTYPNSSAIFELPNPDEWIYVIIQTSIPVPHPIHLHGHDFYVLAQATGTFDDTVTLNLANPPRRDVALLPLSGYLVLAFQTDNPGAWLMHWYAVLPPIPLPMYDVLTAFSHIGWHTLEGFALQFLEMKDKILATLDSAVLTEHCSAWDSWTSSQAIVQIDDSGI